MGKRGNDTRTKKLVDSILDSAFEEIRNLSTEATYGFIQAIKEWVINKYNEVTLSSDNDSKVTLEDLERHIKLSNETIDIGKKEKENNIWWAMQKLGYSKEEIQKVLDLANNTYKKSE